MVLHLSKEDLKVAFYSDYWLQVRFVTEIEYRSLSLDFLLAILIYLS